MKSPTLGICLFLMISPVLLSAETFDPSRYNVTWETPGKGPQDSMPLGNGDITLNAWTLADVWNKIPNAPPAVVPADTIVPAAPGRIGWFHFNDESVGVPATMRHQGLPYDPANDMLLNRVFGGLLGHPAGVPDGERALDAPAALRHQAIDVAAEGMAIRMNGRLLAEHKLPVTNDAFHLTQVYHLQRHIFACAGGGEYPIRFNGSTFTIPHQGGPGGPDYRRWGNGLWWQNIRLPYYAMPAAGDAELMHSLFRTYVEDVVPVSIERTCLYSGLPGAFLPECVYPWGAAFAQCYGPIPFSERGDSFDERLQDSRWHKWEWTGALELLWLFPFRQVTARSPEAERNKALNALRHRWHRGHTGWRQDDLFMAWLGLAEETRDAVVTRSRSRDPGQRYPAFWAPHYDWTPDQTHGGVLMAAVQAMVLQTEGDAIHLLPAWPDDWNVSFRLHAPGKTVVEGRAEGVRLLERKVHPPERGADIVKPN